MKPASACCLRQSSKGVSGELLSIIQNVYRISDNWKVSSMITCKYIFIIFFISTPDLLNTGELLLAGLRGRGERQDVLLAGVKSWVWIKSWSCFVFTLASSASLSPAAVSAARAVGPGGSGVCLECTSQPPCSCITSPVPALGQDIGHQAEIEACRSKEPFKTFPDPVKSH